MGYYVVIDRKFMGTSWFLMVFDYPKSLRNYPDSGDNYGKNRNWFLTGQKSTWGQLEGNADGKPWSSYNPKCIQ